MDSGLTASDVALMSGAKSDGLGSFGGIIGLLAVLGIIGGGFGDFFGGGNRGYQPQYATQDFVQNGFNFNDLQNQNRDILTAINGGTAQAVAATNQAKYDNINVMKDVQAAITAQLTDVRAMEQNIMGQQAECCCNVMRGIDGVNYNAALNTAAINATTTAQTQKILDAIMGNRMADMQNQINQLELQNQLASVVRYPSNTFYAVPSPFFPLPPLPTTTTGGTTTG